MDSAQEMSSQENESLADDVMNSLGEPKEASTEGENTHEEGQEKSHDPLYVQKRLKQQKRAHDREIREMHSKIAELQSRVSPQNDSYGQVNNPYEAPQGGDIEQHIHKAVGYALQHKEMEERKAREAQAAMHVARQYQDLQKHLDHVADKYDDFDDVVRGEHVPMTHHMRDAALFLPKKGPGSAGEVLYKLGKNPEELERIANLHPLEQAREMVNLSHALISGGENKGSEARPLGQIKSNPVTNSHAVTEKTPVGSIRQRMKSGSWK